MPTVKGKKYPYTAAGMRAAKAAAGSTPTRRRRKPMPSTSKTARRPMRRR